jgi:mannose-6-phosphate isomerase
MKKGLPLILELPPNRVRRNYRGGAMLDLLEGKSRREDSDKPEDWIGSVTEALNPGMTCVAEEGLSRVKVNGRNVLLRDLITQFPKHYLGMAHWNQLGPHPGFLTKLLDSATRLHLQAHPTRDFARRELGGRWGKLECYVILSVRSGIDPYIYLGFQHSPPPDRWLQIVMEQNLPAMLSCFEKITVAPGEVWFVPGGVPHALGEGLTLLEVQEPSDLVVRCEFDREGVVVPPEARFMNMDPHRAINLFDYTEYSSADVRLRYCIAPKLLNKEDGFAEYLRTGKDQADCFEILELHLSWPLDYEWDNRFAVAIVIAGRGVFSSDSDVIAVHKGTRFLIAAAVKTIRIEPSSDEQLCILICKSGQPS